MSNQDLQNFEAMAQMLETQGRRLRELEIRLERERQEKAELEMDFLHLLGQINGIGHLTSLDDRAVVCG